MRTLLLSSSVLILGLTGLLGCGEVAPADPDAGPPPIDAPSGMATLAIDRASADLGMVVVGQTSAPAMFTIMNTGTLASGTVTVTTSGAGFAITSNTCTGQPLAIGASCQVAVTATPTAPGPMSGGLMASATPGGSVSASLSATGLAPGALMAMPGLFDFGVVPGGTVTPARTITITNTGGAATGVLTGALGGADAAIFEVVTNGCAGMTLAAAASCDITVRMRPAVTDSGTKSATLTVMATPGGAAMTTLMGTAQLPGVITLGGQTGAFGDVLLGMSVIRTATLTNSGQQATGPITIARNGSAAFSILTGMAGDCVSGVTTLAGGAMCNLRVQFMPSAAGAVTGNVMVSATPGGSQTLNLSGNGLRPATLTATIPTTSFGLVEVNTFSTPITWTITNTGDVASSVPMLNFVGTELDAAAGTCNVAIPAGGMCTVSLRFRPTVGGARTGSATLMVTGSMVTVNTTATGAFRLTVRRTGLSGTITSNPAGINCLPVDASCNALFAPGNVTLQARTTNGSGVHFSTWNGAAAGACLGTPNRDCTLNLTANALVEGVFGRISFNLAFISSVAYPTNLGGMAPYDLRCNQLASAAGINNAAGDAFVAWMSDDNSNVLSRLGATASGWVRMDGRVFAADRNKLLGGQILNGVRYSQVGGDMGDQPVLTGTRSDGSTAGTQHCSNWTVDTGSGLLMGVSMSGPSAWTGDTGTSCVFDQPVMCLMRTVTTGPTPATFDGKRVWLTNGAYPVGGAVTPDAACNADRPAGVLMGRALISRTTATAASLLTAGQMYVRPDGQEVGTGAEISANLARSGIWQLGNGSYVPASQRTWTGSLSPSQLGTPATTGNDWTSVAGTGQFGLSGRARSFAWSQGNATCNAGVITYRLYCYEP